MIQMTATFFLEKKMSVPLGTCGSRIFWDKNLPSTNITHYRDRRHSGRYSRVCAILV